ncbi:unnamed protein product [Ilex paraguariensis]|uniref:WRC domain-containing protein n=1 Tax=Ilex paraguariensis TaxID=185542 RepID=A0ABC8TKH1_9AQUA
MFFCTFFLFGCAPAIALYIVVGRWCERDKVVPLKKRIGSFARREGEEEAMIMENGKKMKAKMKSKTNKKCVRQNVDEKEERETNKEDSEKSSGKRSKKGSVIMEGSRCSRVNGRGWRCCQQTLVGYSLCEHHLGKGRLRSMSSVRNRAMGSKSEPLPTSSGREQVQENVVLVDNGEEDNDDDEKKPLMVKKKQKRMKLGMVKARSISSLLSQTNNAVVEHDNNKNSC